jgi:hypothetical protein
MDSAVDREPSRVSVRACVLDLCLNGNRRELLRQAQRHVDLNDE